MDPLGAWRRFGGGRRLVAALTVSVVLCLAVPGGLAAAAGPSTHAFADIADSRYAPFIDFAAAQGFVGVNRGRGGDFHPNAPVTRVQFAAWAVRMMGLGGIVQATAQVTPSYADAASIPQSEWGDVNAASSAGLLQGYPDGDFAPDNPMTVADVLAALLRAIGRGAAIHGRWPQAYVTAAESAGLTLFLPNDVNWNAPASRGETVAAMYAAYVLAPASRGGGPGSPAGGGASLLMQSPAQPGVLTCTGTVHDLLDLDRFIRVDTAGASRCSPQVPVVTVPSTGTTVYALRVAPDVLVEGAPLTDLRGDRVFLTTDASGRVNYIAVLALPRPPVAPGQVVTSRLDNGSAPPPPGWTEASVDGRVVPYLVVDPSGGLHLESMDGRTPALGPDVEWYLNQSPIIRASDLLSAPIEVGGVAVAPGQIIRLAGLDGVDALTAVSATTPSQGHPDPTAVEGDTVTWAIPAGGGGADLVWLFHRTLRAGLVTEVRRPQLLVRDVGGDQLALRVGRESQMTLDGRAAALTDLQVDDVVDVDLFANDPAATVAVAVAATRRTVSGTVLQVAAGPGQPRVQLWLGTGGTQSLEVAGALLARAGGLRRGAPVRLALDGDGMAYWDLYSLGAQWSADIAEVVGTGTDATGQETVSLDTRGKAGTAWIEPDARAGLDSLVAGSGHFDPFVAVNTIPQRSETVLVWNGLSVYGGTSGPGPTPGNGANDLTGFDDNARIDFMAGHIAGVSALDPIFDFDNSQAVPDGSRCEARAGTFTVPGGTYCVDSYQVYAQDAKSGVVTLQELSGLTDQPTGRYVEAYLGNGLVAYTDGNPTAGSPGRYEDPTGLAVGTRITLWGGGYNAADFVIDNSGGTSGLYQPMDATEPLWVPALVPGATSGGGYPVAVLGLVVQPG